MKQVIIFDLDGTLLNTIADLGAACNYALSRCGLPTHAPNEYPRLVGNGINRLIERALPDEYKALNEAERTRHVMRIRQEFVPYYNAHNCDLTRPYDGILETLEMLKKKGIHLAVASNKYHEATLQIVHHFFGDTFDSVFGEREGIPRKPDPHIVRDILQDIGSKFATDFNTQSTLYIDCLQFSCSVLYHTSAFFQPPVRQIFDISLLTAADGRFSGTEDLQPEGLRAEGNYIFKNAATNLRV